MSTEYMDNKNGLVFFPCFLFLFPFFFSLLGTGESQGTEVDAGRLGGACDWDA